MRDWFMVTSPRLSWLAWATLPLLMSHAADGQIVYVDAHATGPSEDGQSWCTAYRFLQDGLTAAAVMNSDGIHTNDVAEIWVAGGTYRPDQGANQLLGDRNATFALLDGTALRGAYAGCGAGDPSARDTSSDATVLSGDLKSNDALGSQNLGDNSYHILTATILMVDPGQDSRVRMIIDGLTVMSGNAVGAVDPSGGGLYLIADYYHDDTLFVAQDCTFAHNNAGSGGAVVIFNGQSVFQDCRFIGNKAESSHRLTCPDESDVIPGSGGAGLVEGSTSFLGCEFRENTAVNLGGALMSWAGNVDINMSTFEANAAGLGGGAVSVTLAQLLINASQFVGNQAGTQPEHGRCVPSGGAIYNGPWSIFQIGSDATDGRCTVSQNTATRGGAIAFGSQVRGSYIGAVDFIDNEAVTGGAVFSEALAPVHFATTTFKLNRAQGGIGGFIYRQEDAGGAVYHADGKDLSFNECNFEDNYAKYWGGAIAIDNFSGAQLVNCDLLRNTVLAYGGGVYVGPASTIALLDSTFISNEGDSGGGVADSVNAHTTVRRCHFQNNKARDGGGIYSSFLDAHDSVFVDNTGGAITVPFFVGQAFLDGCTIFRNVGVTTGGVTSHYPESFVTIANSILWNNRNANGTALDAQVTISKHLQLQWSCVQGVHTVGGFDPSVIDVDPLFSDPAHIGPPKGGMVNGLELSPLSPCIDAGNNRPFDPPRPTRDVDVDLSWKPRFLDDPEIADWSQLPSRCHLGPTIDMGAFEFQHKCNAITGAGDSNHDTILDACEGPWPVLVESEWVGSETLTGVWSDGEAWCPPRVPDNKPDKAFDVAIPSPGSLVRFDGSRTITALTIGSEGVGSEVAPVLRADDSGPGSMALIVDGSQGVKNHGRIEVVNGRNLQIAADVIAQGAPCDGIAPPTESRGTLVAGAEISPGVISPGIIEINRARVVGGNVVISESSEVRLIGGAELVNVCIEGANGLIVPNGQNGAFQGRITNDTLALIEGISVPTAFVSTVADARLATLEGGGRIQLSSRLFSRLGDVKGAFTNGPGHQIEGAGVILGGLVNQGVIQANVSSDELVITGPGTKESEIDSFLEASLGGTLRLADSLSGAAQLCAQGGAIRLVPIDDPVVVHAIYLEVGAARSLSSPCRRDDSDAHMIASALTMAANTRLLIEGSVVVGPHGAFRADRTMADISGEEPVAENQSLLTASDLEIRGGDAEASDKPGGVSLTGNMEVELRLSLTIDDKGGSHPPPVMRTYDATRCGVAGDTVIWHSLDVTYRSSEPFVLGGNFQNMSADPLRFDWLQGGVKLNGDSLQTYEVAGINLGPSPDGFLVGTSGNCDGAHTNFSLKKLELAGTGGAQFVNAHDNAPGPETEALYVQEFVIHDGAQFSVAPNAVVYYVTVQGSIAEACGMPCPGLFQVPCEGTSACVPVLPDCSLSQCLDGPDLSARPQCRVHDRDADADVDLFDFALAPRANYLTELEKENARHKRVDADLTLDNALLNETARPNF